MLVSERFHIDLTLHFGLLSEQCADEKEFIAQSINIIEEIKPADDFDLEELFFGVMPDKKESHKTLNKIVENLKTITL